MFSHPNVVGLDSGVGNPNAKAGSIAQDDSTETQRQTMTFEGKKVSREEVIRELGDPSTWGAASARIAQQQEEPYIKKVPLWMKIVAGILLLSVVDVLVFATVYTVNSVMHSVHNKIEKQLPNKNNL